MYTTAAIMSIGVLFDVIVVYYAKFVKNLWSALQNLFQGSGHLSRRGRGGDKS